jgi:hypothetical protein
MTTMLSKEASSARARGRAGVLLVADLEQLGDDLAGGEVALEAGEAARAERAAHGAADLGGDADGLARVVEADALLRRADDDRLDERAVAQFEQELVGDVLRLLVEHERGGHEVEGVGEPGAEGFAEVGHLVPRAGALLVDPVENLLRAKRRLAALLQAGGERVEGLAGERWLGGDELHATT